MNSLGIDINKSLGHQDPLEAVSIVGFKMDKVILNLVQDLIINRLRFRNKFGMTLSSTFETASPYSAAQNVKITAKHRSSAGDLGVGQSADSGFQIPDYESPNTEYRIPNTGYISLIILISLLLLTLMGYSQNERKYIRQGNRYYLQGLRDTTKIDSMTFSKAETEYRKALDKRPDDLKWNFNLNNALYKQKKFKDAEAGFGQIAKQMIEPAEKAGAFYNMGNAELFQQELDASIESYKKSLRINPGDMEAKYNLAFAQKMKKQQQQQQKDNKDQNKDQKKNQDQNKDQNKEQQNKQQQPPPKISRENAEQLLQALQNDEKNIQDKVKKAQAVQLKSSRVEKDW